MSVVLPTPSTRVPSPVVGREARTRNGFPVGARFRRRIASADLDRLDLDLDQAGVDQADSGRPHLARVARGLPYPVGARFPRRIADEPIFAPIAVAVRSPRRMLPVGARYPRAAA